MHSTFHIALLGLVTVLTLRLDLGPVAAQDWTPSFKSDEPGPVFEPKRTPKAAKRRFVRSKHQASIRLPTSSAPSHSVHKLAVQVAENNPQLMNLALNNARNVVEYYKSKGEEVAIEIVTFGPGLHMLRDDTSPVKQRIAAMALETPGVTFIACANTQANMSKQENKQISLISEAKVMPSGVVRIMELQGKGYSYLRP
jgi:intracellular sulfur oxidation DsrE/DsrF family protein